MMLLGNKSDCESDRKVSKEEAQQYAKAHNMLFMETSAKYRINIDESFFELTKKILPTMA
jgi:GTPase SAR1 family protein